MNYGIILGSVRNSMIYHIFAVIAGWFSKQWKQSPILQWFLHQRSGEDHSRQSLLFRLACLLHRFLLWLCRALRLDKITENSIFRKPVLWTGLTLVCAPVLPTMAILALTMVSLCSLLLTFGCEENRTLVYFPVNKFVYAFAFVYVFCAFTSVTPGSSLKISAMFCMFALFFILLTNSITTYRQLKAISALLVFAGVLVSFYGFYQYLTGGQRIGAWVDKDMFNISFRVYSTLANPNVLGEYLLLVIPLCVGFLFSAKTWFKRIVWAGCFCVMMLCMVLTYSRGCWLGICLAAAIFMVMYDRRFLLVGIALLAIAPFVLPESILQRITSIGNMGDTSTSYRVYIWMGTIAMLKEFWFSGVGPGKDAYNTVYPAFSYSHVSAPHAHNLFLQTMCDTGISGTVLLCLVLFSATRTLCSATAAQPNKENKLFQMAGIAAIAGFLLQSMFDYTFYNYRVMLMFWGFLGIYLMFTKLREEETV